MAAIKKQVIILTLFCLMNACASVDTARIEEKAFENGSLFMTVQTYELLLDENYQLLKLMDEEGDRGPSRHRNLVTARLNSALYQLGALIKSFEGRSSWPRPVLEYAGQKGYVENKRRFIGLVKKRWRKEWKESFDREDPEGYRELAIETYLKYGNAFGIKGLIARE